MTRQPCPTFAWNDSSKLSTKTPFPHFVQELIRRHLACEHKPSSVDMRFAEIHQEQRMSGADDLESSYLTEFQVW